MSEIINLNRLSLYFPAPALGHPAQFIYLCGSNLTVMKEYQFTIVMETRDYEADAQGIINNANYQHYMEVTRHKWLKTKHESFEGLHVKGIDMVVAEVSIRYKSPLRGGEEFVSCMNVRREGVRFIFDQDIYRRSDMKLCTHGRVSAVCLDHGRLTDGTAFDYLLEEN